MIDPCQLDYRAIALPELSGEPLHRLVELEQRAPRAVVGTNAGP